MSSFVSWRNAAMAVVVTAGTLPVFAMQTGAASASATTDVQAALKTPVDSRHAKVGEEVTAITRNNATLGSTRLPKGSTLIGHITDVKAKGASNANGSVTMLFDQARLKDGTVVPVHATIRSLAPATQMQSSTDADAAFAGPRGGDAGLGAGADVSARGNGGGGGLLGGAAGVTRGAVGGALGAAGDATSAAAGAVGETARTATGATAAGVSSIRGVSLAAGADASTSGTIAAQGQNLHLDSGTQMTLGVAAR